MRLMRFRRSERAENTGSNEFISDMSRTIENEK